MKFPSRSRKDTTKAFTLIELLVVISIIAVLAGLILPAAGNALASAQKTTAKNQAVQIATAIAAYETEYGRLPAFNGTNLSADNVAMLCSTNDASNNPRGIVFLEANSWRKGKGGTNDQGFCDPFGATNVYSVMLDTNYSNLLNGVPSQVGNGPISTTNLTKHIAVWTIWNSGKKTNLISSWD